MSDAAHAGPDSEAPLGVAILALPEVSASVVYGMFDLFMSAGRDWGLIVDGRPGRQYFAPRITAETPAPMEVGNGVSIRPDATFDDGPLPSVVCVPELLVPPGDSLDGRFGPQIDWLRRCHAAGATIATACSGALLLAEAGLLNGCDATTHWAYCDIMKRRYPQVRVHAQRALVISGQGQRLVMAGGGTSWLDLALYLIARFASVNVAMQVARVNLIDWHHIGQQPFARLAQSRQVEDALIARCQTWIAQHYDDSAPVAGMTQLSGLAERSFARRFQQATGMAPLEYVHTLRLEEAKHLLESGPDSIEAIANEVGYEDAGFFSRLFRRKVGLTPAQYRRRFGSLRRAMQSGGRARPSETDECDNLAPMQPIWTPSPERVADANLTRFITCVNARRSLKLTGYPDLYAWSIAQPGDFWAELARFADVRADWGKGPAIENGERMPGARFFPSARLNFAQNLLRFRDRHPAIVFRNDRGTRRELSFAELYEEVARVAAGLKAAGVGAGDRVAGFLPNVPEATIAMLAAASIGAIWSSCSPDFGANGVLDRFGQIEPKVLIIADGYFYGGKTLDSLAVMAQVVPKIASVRKVVVMGYVNPDPALDKLADAQALATRWSTFGTRGAKLEFAPLPFDHPLYILYSSGTTGVPKCIVHGAGGTLLQHQKEHLLHTDIRRSDRVFYFTTCGWMMWNWLMSVLATGATIVLYDGSPFHPEPGALWRMAEQERINVFGTSAKFIAATAKSDFDPEGNVNLACLRAILSTGSPLLPEHFDYVYQHVKGDVQLASISGGTDIVSCFALGSPTQPVYRGELQARGLGMRVEIFNDEGRAVRGERGELVCTAPFPSMPVGFWNDMDGRKYRAAYFERFPGIWHHGDYATLTEHDGIIIHGRSDAVLNPGGVRIGTAEIYAVVERMEEITEALAVGQEWRGDVRVVLFVRLKPGFTLDESLRKKIRDAIREGTTPRHVPARVIEVPDIPRTLSGKITELAVRNVIHGLPVKNVDALANPQALEHFRNLPDLES